MTGTSHLSRRQALGAVTALVLGGLERHANAQGQAILVGQSVPLSGPIAGAFEAPLAGQRLAVDALNAAGGIDGRPLQMLIRDDAYDTRRTVDNVRELVEQDRVVALTGLGSTAGVGAILPYLAEKRVPLVGAWTGAHVLRLKPHPTFFTSQASFQDEVEHALRTLSTIKLDSIGIALQDNAFGQSLLPVIEASARSLGLNVVRVAPLAVDGSNAAAAARELAEARPKAVYLVAVGPSVAGFVRAARAQINVPVYTLSVAAGAVPSLGKDAHGLAMTQIVPLPWRQVDPMAREFNRLAAAAQVPISYNAYGGYLGARFLIEALRRASPRVTAESIVSAIQGIRNWSLGGNLLTFGPGRHHGSTWAEITIINADGRFVR
ncbi:MAG: ABC transporter substrate-binding protein [Gammaproteobacteria bacterium]